VPYADAGVVEADPVANNPSRLLQGIEAVPVDALPFKIRISRSTMPLCSGRCGRYGFVKKKSYCAAEKNPIELGDTLQGWCG
jgi:hypothetical protein